MKKTLEKLRTGKHVTIVAFGDSITEVTFHTRGRMNWVQLLEEAIFEEYGNGVCTMINSGKCASSYREGLTRIERDVLCFNPDLVILAFGMNDAGAGLDGLAAFKENVRKTITLIREQCGSEILIRTPNPVVTVHGMPLPVEQQRPGQVWENPRRPLKEYAAALVELAAELNCSCVDHYTLWYKRNVTVKHPVTDPCNLWPRMGDAIHPGFLGHLAFFRELAPLFELPEYFPWEEVIQ
jgi:lysophospholipase L1-like esterase